MKQKILILANSLNIGGVEKSLISLLQSIDYNNYEVDLVLKRRGDLQKNIPIEVNMLKTPNFYEWIFMPKKTIFQALISSIGVNLNCFRFIYYLLKGILIKNMGIARQQLIESSLHTLQEFKGEYDVAIDYTGNFRPLIVNKVKSHKKITWIHSDYRVYQTSQNIDEKYFELLDGIVTVSKSSYEIFLNVFPELEYKTHIMQNISNKKTIKNMANEMIDFDNDYNGIKILDVTRLDPNKGLELAIQTCYYLVNEGFDIKWYIVGDGPERKNLENLINEKNLQNNFKLLGLKSNPYPYMNRSDIIVHCSLYEGKSVAIDEAMLLKKPIILTNYPTAKDQIDNGYNGIICEASVDKIADSIKLLITNENERNRLINNLEEFDLDVEKSMEKFYEIIKI